MKRILLFVLLCMATAQIFAQSAKTHPPKKNVNTQQPVQLNLNVPQAAVPPAENPFGLTDVQYRVLAKLEPQNAASAPGVRITRDKNGMPILFEGQTEASVPGADLKASAIAYLSSLHPQGITDPAGEFVAGRVETDNAGNSHIRIDQVYQGVPVYGAEVIAHARNGVFDLLNGRYYSTPQLASVAPALDAARAIDQVKLAIGPENIHNDWTPEQVQLLQIQPFKAELVIYHPGSQPNNARLAWHVEAHPAMMKRLIYFIDANTGEVIHSYDYTCRIDGHPYGPVSHDHSPVETAAGNTTATIAASAPPPVNATGTDLLGQVRSFGAWQQGATFYLEDAGKSMFNSGASTMPADPVGVIITLDAGNTSPQNQNFDYNFVTSNSSVFSNSAASNGANAVSAHWNSIKSYDYYLNTHGRNSIDGVGGNIIAFINVSESNGASMENAYWDGAAMWYGNGGTTFKKLARGLDVGGHEMTHGVVEKTANLVYQDESGALNESFADIFGAMIDNDDWLIGEDVMQSGTNAALRSMSDPHNGVTSSSPWWQPRTVSEQYNGSQDNGGVHINSGISNWAFYLFATNANVGKPKAEKVYYKALKDYLVKSSQFVDLRIAVLQAANDLYPAGNTVANAAAAAFDQVGILGSTPGGNYLGTLTTNPGTDYVLCVSNDFQNLELRNGSGSLLKVLYTGGVLSRPSVTDNGNQIVFINAAKDAIYIDVVYTNPIQATPGILLNDPDLRNIAISKDGHFVAALVDDATDNHIYVVDLFSLQQGTFELYNPTYSTGQSTGYVQYADVLEFDYSNQYVMYDAYNELSSSTSGDISYWDIGFLKFWENGGYADPNGAFISKLFSGLPEKTSVGNPTFSKNSPYIIAFDYYDATADQNDLYGANTETGDLGLIVSNNGAYGWSNYNRLDNALIYEGPNQAGVTNIYKRSVNTDKITGQNNETLFIGDRQLAVWYANGNRSLSVGTGEAADQAFSLSVSPNPATDLARIGIESKTTGNALVTLCNLAGATLQSREIQLNTGSNQLEVNLHDLPAGVYLVRLSSGDNVAALKVVKQ